MLMLSNISFAQWSLSGNTVSSTDFIGTTNNEDLLFYTNNQRKMLLNTYGYLIIDPNNSSANIQPTTLTIIDKGAPVFLTILNNPSTIPSVPGELKIGLNNDGPDAIINQVVNANLSLYTYDTERFTIQGDGKIGINNSSPTVQLDINGDYIALRNSNAAINKVLTTDANGVATWQELSLNLLSNILTVNGFSGIDLSNYLDNTDNQVLSFNGNTLSLTNGGNVDLSVYENTDEQTLSVSGNNLTISGGNTITLTDNVNDADADISNELITNAELNNTSLEITEGVNSTITTVDLSGLQDGFEANTDNQNLSLNGTNLSIDNGNNVDLGNLNYWEKQTEDLYYNTGNVGIGIETPQSMLHIHNDTPLAGVGIGTGVSKNGGNILPDITDGGTSTIQLTNEHTGSTVNDGFFIQNTEKNGIINLKEIGNIDFKINNQNAISIYSSRDVKINKLAGNGNRIIVANSQGVLQASTNINDLSIWNKVGNKVFYNSGNVGIGTDEPEQKLDINGRLQVRGSDIILGIGDGREQGDYLKNRAFVHAGDDKLIINYYDCGNQSTDFEGGVQINGEIQMTNNVGIGTEPKTNYRLAVNGTILAKEVKIRTANSYWADFVFDDDYKIQSLDKLEKFIKQNKHLPNIPTAKEVEIDGIAVGEMNKLLLQKIEELTLYIIAQDKRIKALENK